MNSALVRLIKHFGTQTLTAAALGVDQTTISGWLRGKHQVSVENAFRAQVATRGAILATELRPSLVDFGQAMSQTIQVDGEDKQASSAAGHPYSTDGASS